MKKMIATRKETGKMLGTCRESMYFRLPERRDLRGCYSRRILDLYDLGRFTTTVIIDVGLPTNTWQTKRI